MMSGAPPNVQAWVYEATAVMSFSVTGRGCSPDTARLIALIYSGEVPQQPPTTRTPDLTSADMSEANCSAPTEYTVSPSLSAGSPALGFTTTGVELTASMRPTTSVICAGASEQLTPSASTPRPSSTATAASGEVPVMVLPSSPNTSVASTGSEQLSFAAMIAAFISYMSFIVSMAMRSAPASAPADMVILNISTASSKVMLPSGASMTPSEPTSRATSVPLDAAARTAQLMPARTTSRVRSPNFKALAPNVLAYITSAPAAM